MPVTIDDLRHRRDEIIDMARRRGARRVLVFGSVARGDAGTASDVDLLVEFEPREATLPGSGSPRGGHAGFV